MNREILGGCVGTALSATGTALQTNDILQTISLIITIIGGLITVIVPLVNWYKKATSKDSDGGEKITKEELKEGIDTAVKGAEDLKNTLKDIDDKNKNK